VQDYHNPETIYSFSSTPPGRSDRRESERFLTLYRVGSITIDGKSELCLVRNVSAGGMKIRVYHQVSVGAALSIELKSGQGITGKVGWVDGHNIGVTFDEPIDIVGLLSASLDGPRPRMPRIELGAEITIREGTSTYRVLACDISQGGLKVATQTILPIGGDVVITLRGLQSLAGVVRWSENGFCGMTFNKLLPLPELVNWMREQPEGILAIG